jgi:hypothetical protein
MARVSLSRSSCERSCARLAARTRTSSLWCSLISPSRKVRTSGWTLAVSVSIYFNNFRSSRLLEMISSNSSNDSLMHRPSNSLSSSAE